MGSNGSFNKIRWRNSSRFHDFGLDTNPVLASLASKMEIDACNMSIDSADLVLMDGSLYSQFMTRQASLTESMINAMKKETM